MRTRQNQMIKGKIKIPSNPVEDSLKASEVSYRRLFETAQDGFLIIDADTGRITDVNPFLVDLLGYSRKDFIDKALWNFGPFKDIRANKSAFEDLMRNGYIRYEHLPLETKDGRRVEVEFISNTYQVGRKPTIQCNIRDISQRKEYERNRNRLESQLKQAQKMAAVAALAGGMAHLFNNELTIITSGLNLLEEAMTDERVKHFSSLAPGIYASLTVEDNGKGMGEETRNRVFEPFFTTHFPGRGLGMAAVYGIVKNHDGWIFVESQLGMGTIVKVRLPALVVSHAKETAKQKHRPVRGAGMA